MTLPEPEAKLAKAVAVREECRIALREHLANTQPKWWQRKARREYAETLAVLQRDLEATAPAIDDAIEVLLRSSIELQRHLFEIHNARRQRAEAKYAARLAEMESDVAHANARLATELRLAGASHE